MGWDTSGRGLAAVSWKPDRRRVRSPALSLGLALLQAPVRSRGRGMLREGSGQPQFPPSISLLMQGVSKLPLSEVIFFPFPYLSCLGLC